MMTKKTITLQFASFEDLWQFRRNSNITSFEINRSINVLTFSGTEEQKQTAMATYKATLINAQEENKESLD